MTLKEIINIIPTNHEWLLRYKNYIPKFLEEARKAQNWDRWDSDVFNEFLIKRDNQCISSLKIGYFQNEDIEKIKQNWHLIAPLFKELSNKQDEPDFALYKKIEQTIRTLTINNQPVAVHRIITSLQPQLLCTIIADKELKSLYKNLKRYCTDTDIPVCTNNWYKDSHNIATLIQNKFPEANYLDIAKYPWQINKFLENYFQNKIKEKIKLYPQFSIQKSDKDFMWIADDKGLIGTNDCHYELCFDDSEDAEHSPDRVYVEVHFEGNGKSQKFFSETVTEFINNNDKIKAFHWQKHCDGIRCNNEGYSLSSPTVVEDVINELITLDNIVRGNLHKAINNYIYKGQIMNNIQKYIDLLKTNHNIVLTGAPGTGKSYLAKQIASTMDAECEMVQFHPSYDYSDFVEGLRPIQKEGQDNIGFERKDGVFKSFCKKAINSYNIGSIDNFEDSWKALIEYLDENDFLDVPLKKQKTSEDNSFRIELNEYGTGLASRIYDENGNWIKGKSKFFSKEQLYNIYQGLSGVPSGGHDNYRKCIIAKMHEKPFSLKEYKAGDISNNIKNFVFIIDEINRGEISKIFGELFFSIDPGYRGKTGTIQTQYQNLIPEGDIFKDGFYIPENIYIIGTMNDIDRSVESMDFAMRRRFCWCEITAEESAFNMQLTNEAKERMTRLNNKISSDEIGLTKPYHIGAAYFLNTSDFTALWNNRLESLLYEYLRGMDEIEEKMRILKDAYNNINKE